MTQADVGELLHMQREVYRRYEKEIREIPVSALIRLADFYGVSVDYLLGRAEEREPYKT